MQSSEARPRITPPAFAGLVVVGVLFLVIATVLGLRLFVASRPPKAPVTTTEIPVEEPETV